MRNQKVLIFGGAGSIGSELVRQLSIHNPVFIFDIDETRTYDLYEELRQKKLKVDYQVGDIRDKQSVFDSVWYFEPNWIINAAAYKHVAPMERFPRQAIEVNELGTCNILEAVDKFKIKKFTFISTDKAVNPKCMMGITKRACEIMVANAGHTSVRFGNVMGSRGSVIPIWQAQIDRGEPLTITDERMERYFMTISEACRLVIEAARIGRGGEVVAFEMGKKINILDLAKQVLQKGGKDVGIKTIGIRPGESLTEEIMSPEEKLNAQKVGQFYIIKIK